MTNETIDLEEAIAGQNFAAAASKLRNEPSNEEMKAAWDNFKSTQLFAALIAHHDPKWILDNEGFLWCLFYNGYMKGATR